MTYVHFPLLKRPKAELTYKFHYAPTAAPAGRFIFGYTDLSNAPTGSQGMEQFRGGCSKELLEQFQSSSHNIVVLMLGVVQSQFINLKASRGLEWVSMKTERIMCLILHHIKFQQQIKNNWRLV